jgi:hypothetical protein
LELWRGENQPGSAFSLCALRQALSTFILDIDRRQFYLSYDGHEKLQPLVGEISWAKHLVILGKCKDPLEREFYYPISSKWLDKPLI